MPRLLKAFLAVVFGVLWFAVTMGVIALLILPQVCVNAYGKDVNWIDNFADLMDEVFDSFKEL